MADFYGTGVSVAEFNEARQMVRDLLDTAADDPRPTHIVVKLLALGWRKVAEPEASGG
jgi:hypothetical protein